ncbi:MAG: undecaprenyldiphospho-muramoylpentapeptide beta-N-acetylglucosaminyltransferase [Desulforhopalus sp.]
MSKASKHIKLLLTGGGTGGHLFPAVATAQHFRQRFPETEVLFVGTKRKVDTGSLARYGFRSESIMSYGLKGKNLLELLKAVAVIPLSYGQALRVIKKFNPDILLGVGGYVTGPVVVAGKTCRVPVLIHEQNSVPGLANRKLGKIADRICLSLPGSGAHFPQHKVTYTGNPVRTAILELSRRSTGVKQTRKTMLVLGGSQGARAVNTLISEALSICDKDKLAALRVIHQTGEADAVRIREAYERIGVEAVVQPFFENMEEVYGQADLLVSRAGATTLSEIAVLGKPAILVPYPYAADNHQEKNGEYYVAGGGAVQFRENELTPELLAKTVYQLLEDEERLAAMSRAMRRLAFPDAAERIVSCCLEEMEKHRRS